MLYRINYKPLARAESADAYEWYAQPNIKMGMAFREDVRRTEAFLKTNPTIYAKVEGDMRKAVLKRFPYSLFYIIDDDRVIVLSVSHQNREPVSFIES
jgi:plasmid stabilization system protein ParE